MEQRNDPMIERLRNGKRDWQARMNELGKEAARKYVTEASTYEGLINLRREHASGVLAEAMRQKRSAAHRRVWQALHPREEPADAGDADAFWGEEEGLGLKPCEFTDPVLLEAFVEEALELWREIEGNV